MGRMLNPRYAGWGWRSVRRITYTAAPESRPNDPGCQQDFGGAPTAIGPAPPTSPPPPPPPPRSAQSCAPIRARPVAGAPAAVTVAPRPLPTRSPTPTIGTSPNAG